MAQYSKVKTVVVFHLQLSRVCLLGVLKSFIKKLSQLPVLSKLIKRIKGIKRKTKEKKRGGSDVNQERSNNAFAATQTTEPAADSNGGPH